MIRSGKAPVMGSGIKVEVEDDGVLLVLVEEVGGRVGR